MKALRLMNWKSEPELVEVPKPTPGPGQVVIKIAGAGACHSDLHLMHDFEAGVVPWNPPFTLGHENAGWVDSIGAGVTTVKDGDAVAVYGPWGCGTCSRCRLGIETLCENPMAAPIPGGGGGLGLDGGMAEYMLVPFERFLVPLPANLDPIMAAPLTDAGLTPYHAVRRSWSKMTPDATVVVIGVGGLGHMAVQFIKATTAATIIAVDMKNEALELAKKVGADHAIVSDDKAAATIRELTGGRGADVVLDFVGAEPTMKMALAAARTLGDVTLIGIAGGSVPFSFFSQGYEVSLQTIYWGSKPELIELLDMAGRGLVHAEYTKYTLDNAPQAYLDLQAGKVKGRAVIVP
ncbi:MAG: NAD(P)-dependent alcohol dehydrogenase [Actinobacteria bacterium]|nr:NAD(P)-dependent alcohol dehydrogenase [Actinomycetota bacterium]